MALVEGRSRLVGADEGAYLGAMVLRCLFALIVGLGVMLSPLTMASGGMAVAHAASIDMAEADGPCAGNEMPSDGPSSPAKMECATACAAFTPGAPAVREQLLPPEPAAVMAPHQRLAGIRLEGETPPPRIIPEI